jgi:PPK2 family polyphosphate:nucleotide phosphotransferase
MSSVTEVLKRLRVERGDGFALDAFSPSDTGGLATSKKEAQQQLHEEWLARLPGLQERLWATDRWAVLLIFQGMDASGKDGVIKHVMSGVNPQGCQVTSFKVPSEEELDHDYLWRTTRALPERGRIGIFNRSYYEEVLVVRVHAAVLARQKLPPRLVGPDLWRQRFEDIAAFERYLTRNGTVVVKFFLHMSREEQRRRFLDRLERPEKRWKFSLGDVAERRHWDRYMAAYEEMIRHTAAPHAPWYVVPADHKWFARLVVAAVVVSTLESLDLEFPAVDAAHLADLEEARRQLVAEGGGG